MSNYYELKRRINAAESKAARLNFKKTELKREIRKLTFKKKRTRSDLRYTTKAREVINKALDITQAQLKMRIDSLVTLAINSVFDRPFSFELVIEKKYNRIICTPFVKEGEYTYSPKDDMGGGIIDIISFALRVVLWSLEHPRSRNTFVLDEPMRFVGKGEMLNRAGEILKELSHRLGFQLIVVTHEEELAQIGDKAYQIEHKQGVSTSTLI